MASKNAPAPADGLLVPGRARTLAAIKRIRQELADLEKIVRSIKEAPPRLGTGVQVEVHPEPKRHTGVQLEVNPEPKRRPGGQVEIHPEPKRQAGRKTQAAGS